MFPVDLMYGYYTMHKENNRLDYAIVEASAITEDGGIIPGASVGASPEIIQMAEKVSPIATAVVGGRKSADELAADHYRGQHCCALLRGSS